MSTLADPVLFIILRLALSALLFWAALHKLRDILGFRAAVAGYALLPPAVVGLSAALVIALELMIGTVLILGGTATSAAALAAAALLSLYTLAIVINLFRGRRHIDCGCSGTARRQRLSGYLVVRNGVLVMAALVNLAPPGGRALTWVDGITIAAGVITLALLYIAADTTIANAAAIAALARHHASAVETASEWHGEQHA